MGSKEGWVDPSTFFAELDGIRLITLARETRIRTRKIRGRIAFLKERLK